MGQPSRKAEKFLQYLEPLQPSLEGYCHRALLDSNAVADVLQSTIAKTFRDFQHYIEGTNFRAWIFRYLHHEIANHNRQTIREPVQPLSNETAIEETWDFAIQEPLMQGFLDNPEQILQQCEDQLAEAIRKLTANERSVLLLKAIGEFKYREIGEILEMPIGTVLSHLSRARLRLRQLLTQLAIERGLLDKEIRGTT